MTVRTRVCVTREVLFEAQCTLGTPPGGTDTDGDGVPDTTDPFPSDPTKCGDGDGDGCDDCASGRYDPASDCAAAEDAGVGGGATGDASGCCEALLAELAR